jgi:hypothetical protein
MDSCTEILFCINVAARIKSKTSDCRQEDGEPTKNMVVVGIMMEDGDVWCAPLVLQ